MKNPLFLKALAVFLAVCAFFSCAPLSTATANDSEPIFVLAGSDFQASTAEEGARNVKSIISAIKSDGYDDIDGFLFGGDYSTDYDAMDEEIAALKGAVKSEYSGLADKNMIFVQGNHDPATSAGLSASGANDSEHYGVFVINEDDYMWYNSDEARIKATANALESYLKQKKSDGYIKPIFITSHLALNYSRRTYNDGDGMYAKHLFDVLNNYGESLNIIFLFGHNHNNRYDDHIGGSMVFLDKGDTIFISKLGNKTATPDACTLNFTYMNYGYVSAAYCLNNTYSMTLFEIRENMVLIKRYGESGMIPLKTKGVWAKSLEETADFFGTDDSYLDYAYDSPVYTSNCGFVNGVSIVSTDVTNYDIWANPEMDFSDLIGLTAFCEWGIEYKDASVSSGIVSIQPPEIDFDFSKPIIVRDAVTGETFALNVKNKKITFKAERLSSHYEIYQTSGAAIGTQKKEIYQPVSQFVDGANMLIVSKNTAGEAFALKNTSGTAITAQLIEIKNGYGSQYIESDDNGIKWKFVHDADFGYASAIGDLQNLATGKYLVAPNGITLSAADSTGDNYTAWRNAASTVFGVYTLPEKYVYDRYYLKYDSGFTISATEDSVHRVYLFASNEVEVEYSAYFDGVAGKVSIGSSGKAKLGSKIFLVATDGEIKDIDATVSMLVDENGNPVSTSSAGVYDGLSLVYNGVTLCENFTLTVTDDAPAVNKGDVNNDGAIDQFDYILVKRHYFETRYLTDDEMTRADVNSDGAIDQFDYILIKRHYFGTYTIE